MTSKNSALTRARISVPLTADFMLRRPERPDSLFVLLHGYSQSAPKLFAKVEPLLPPGAAVLAPNGPYPLPVRREDRYDAGYSWYFYDPLTGEYFIDMETGIEYLRALIRDQGLEGLPTTWIGFSQGGYIAPFAARRISTTRRVIGIACETLVDELELPLPFRVDAIHGDDDEIVPIVGAQESFDRLTRSSAPELRGEWIRLPGVGHRIESQVLASLKNLLSSY